MELLLLGLLPLLAFGLINASGGDDGEPGPDVDGHVTRDDGSDSTLDGTPDQDLILGGGGADQVAGGAGSDIAAGEAGDDTLRGGEGDDLVLGGAGDDTLLGGLGDDALVGGTGDDSLSGGSDNDLLFGSSGADTLSGDSGSDTVLGLDVRDTITAEGALDADFASLTSGLQDAFSPNLTGSDITRVENGVLSADPGNPAADALFGGNGADLVVGDNGDTLSGGAGNDSFNVYHLAGDAVPVITDFNAGIETLSIVVDGPATGTLSFVDGVNGLGVRLDGTVVALLQGVVAADIIPGSITLDSASV